MRFFLLLLLIISSCAKKQEIPLDDSGVRRIPVSSPQEAEKLLSQAKLGCQNPEDCSSSVGMILSQTKTEVITCTAFLVEKDLVVTNSHCIPYEFKNGKSCQGFIQILLPVHTKGKAKHNCKEIINYSERPNALSPDLAVLRLETSSLQNPLELSKEGFSESLMALKVNPLKGASGILVRENCNPALNSYRFPLFQSPSNPVALLGDCQSLPGNSGSPLLNAKKAVVGLLQANVPVNEPQKKAWGPYLAKGETFAPLVLATNISCLSSLPWQWNEECQIVEEENIKRPRIIDFESSDTPKGLNTLFQWKPNIQNEKALEREIEWTPICVDKTLTMNPKTLKLPLPLQRERIEFNRYLQMKLVNLAAAPKRSAKINLVDGTFPACGN